MPCTPWYSFSHTLRQVSLPCCFPAPQVAFVFVLFQYLSDILAEGAVDVAEGFGHVLMYRALADSVPSGCLPYGGTVLYDIGTEDHATLLVCRYVHHAISPPYCLYVLIHTLCGASGDYP